MPTRLARAAQSRIWLAVGTALIAVAATGALAYRESTAFARAFRRAEYSHAVAEQVRRLQQRLLTARVEMRTLLATGDTVYVRALHDAEAALEEETSRLRALSAGSEDQEARMAQLEDVLDTLRAQRARMVAGQARGIETSRAYVTSTSHVAAIAAAEGLLRAMEQREIDVVRTRTAEEVNSARILAVAIVAVLISAGLLVLWTAREIRRGAATLGASEMRFRRLADANPDGMMVVQAGGRVLYANVAAANLFGASAPEALIGCILTELVHPDDRTVATERAEQILVRHELPAPRIVRFLHADGHAFEAETRGALINFEGTDAAAVVMRDVTERRRAERAVAESEARFRLLADNSVDLVSKRTVDHRFEYASPSHFKVLGWSPDELIGQSALQYLHPDDVRRMRSSIDRLEHGIQPGPEIVRARHRDGHYVWLESVAKPIVLTDDSLAGVLVSARDISARKALEDRLEHAQRMEAMVRMANGVAHDVNNLLMVVSGASELLRAPELDAARRTAVLDEIDSAVQRTASLSAQLLAFTSRRPSARMSLAVGDFVRDLHRRLPAAVNPKVELAVTITPAAEAACIDADPALVAEVVHNLVSNANDAMPDGGLLKIASDLESLRQPVSHRHGTLAAGRYVVLSVRDTGTGMNDDTLAHLFDPFFTTKRQGEGAGLGLATAFGIVEQARGGIVVESNASEGSTLKVYWPLAAVPTVERMHAVEAPGVLVNPIPAAPATGIVANGEGEAIDRVRAVSAQTPAQRPGAVRERVLVVDDEDSVRRMVALLLTRGHFDVVAAASAAEALGIVRGERADLSAIVTDVRMPTMTGIEMVDQLIREGIDLPVLFMSGQLDAPLPTGWPPTAPRAFIGKPFTGQELTAALRTLLDVAASRAAFN